MISYICDYTKEINQDIIEEILLEKYGYILFKVRSGSKPEMITADGIDELMYKVELVYQHSGYHHFFIKTLLLDYRKILRDTKINNLL